MQMFHDNELAEHALKHLRRAYPYARVLLQSDGDADAAYDDLAMRYNCAYFVGKRLYGQEQGGKMLQRMLNEGVDNKLFPVSSLRQGPPQGGCVMIPRAVAAELRTSRVFLDGRLYDAHASWGKPMQQSFLEEQLSKTGRIGFEWTLFWGCTELGIPVLPHPEIHATWKQGHLNTHQQYAAVHPDKFMNIEDDIIHNQCTVSHTHASNVYLRAIYETA